MNKHPFWLGEKITLVTTNVMPNVGSFAKKKEATPIFSIVLGSNQFF